MYAKIKVALKVVVFSDPGLLFSSIIKTLPLSELSLRQWRVSLNRRQASFIMRPDTVSSPSFLKMTLQHESRGRERERNGKPREIGNRASTEIDSDRLG